MFHDLLTKVTGHEEDWHEVIERLSREMEGKLNRVELDSLKRQLEDRWRSIRKELRSLPPPPSDGAAAMTRQLAAGFRCLSCSMPVNVRAPGPHTTAAPPPRHAARAQHLAEAQSVAPALIRPLAGEVDITGSDGQIYKGRLSAKTPRTAADQRLPTLSPRESASCKGGDSRVLRSQAQRSGSAALTRPQSSRTERGRPGSAGGSGWARPAAAAPVADERCSLAESCGELQRRAPVTELHVDLRPPEGEGPGTNL
ncbi:hypothetical protein CRUP_029422 [Coryphaenoides rupestris]|nr:hypothetical protein CRUP_029422 [Coryphaenoides rupestris]